MVFRYISSYRIDEKILIIFENNCCFFVIILVYYHQPYTKFMSLHRKQQRKMMIMDTTWKSFLSHDEKNRILFNRQKALLDLFLRNGAITKREHDSLTSDMAEKMGMLSA